VRYSIYEYDKHGFLSAPRWLWLGWLFLARAWIVFIVAGVSRNDGSRLLEIIYPVHSLFYTGLVVGLPAIVLIWLMGLRTAERKRICQIMRHGRRVTLSLILIQLGLEVYQIVLEGGKFSLAHAVTLVLLGWMFLYFYRSRRVADCFRSPLLS